MTKTDYEKLIEEIRKHDRLYYVENKPVISDYEYDLLLKKLEKMEADHPDWVTRLLRPSVSKTRSPKVLSKSPILFRCSRWTTPISKKKSKTLSNGSINF